MKKPPENPAHAASQACAVALVKMYRLIDRPKKDGKQFAAAFLDLHAARDAGAAVNADDWLPFRRVTLDEVHCLGEVAASWHEVALCIAESITRSIVATAEIVDFKTNALDYKREPLKVAACIRKNFGVPHRANFTDIFAGTSFDPVELIVKIRVEFARLPDTGKKPGASTRDQIQFESKGAYFVHLRATKKMTDAKIRDHWESLSEGERREICPTDWFRLETSKTFKHNKSRPQKQALADIVKASRKRSETKLTDASLS
jgi:hypothetical protein